MRLKTASCFNVDLAAIEDSLTGVAEHWSASDGKLCSVAALECLAKPAAAALVSPGKRMRPLLSLWTYRNLIQDFHTHILDLPLGPKILTAATACEMLHAASLVVDDVQDGSAERRGVPSIFSIFGIDVAINAGSWMFFEAQHLLGTCDLLKDSVDLLRRCHQGQALDLSTTRDAVVTAALNCSVDDLRSLYKETAHLKTAQLMQFGISAVFKLSDRHLNAGATRCSTAEASSQRQERASECPDSLLIDHLALAGDYGFLYQKVDDFRNLSSALSSQKACEDLSSIRNYVTIEFIGLLNAAERSRFRRALDAGTLRPWILGHEKFRPAMESVRTDLLESLQKCASEADQLCPDPDGRAYLDQVIHAPLKHLVEKVMDEYHLQMMAPLAPERVTSCVQAT